MTTKSMIDEFLDPTRDALQQRIDKLEAENERLRLHPQSLFREGIEKAAEIVQERQEMYNSLNVCWEVLRAAAEAIRDQIK